jgi:hypothetical protein
VFGTLVGSVYVFGFITMTPQLYINYKLKSVEHMPGRALVYRFLNTIIDDLFSFIITMPTMHRLACFRDDIIFVIYIYQRWIYKVDKNRDPYGVLKKEEEKAQAVQEEQKLERSALVGETTETPTEGDTTRDGIVTKREDGDLVKKRSTTKG